MSTVLDQVIWHTTKTAGPHVGNHPDTIRKACESGELHGSQRRPNGRWRIHVDCLDAWAGGEQCAHQIAGSA